MDSQHIMKAMSWAPRRKLALSLGLVTALLLVFGYQTAPRFDIYHDGSTRSATTIQPEVAISADPTVLKQPAIATPAPLLPPPADYNLAPVQSGVCEDRFTTKYLDILRQNPIEYCSDSSASRFTCFSTPADFHGPTHRDTFCIGQNAHFNPKDERFDFDCSLAEVKDVPITSFQYYWYETGPRTLMDKFVTLKNQGGARTNVVLPPSQRDYTILLKREGSNNIFHSLHEIMSAAYTMDALRMARDPATGQPFYDAPPDLSNTRVVILDDIADGPYFDLWRLVAGREPKRLKELTPEEQDSLAKGVGNIILPLAGGANPVWHDNWAKYDCQNDLRRTFSRRILDLYNIPQDGVYPQIPDPDRPLTLTFVDRKQTRVLRDSEALLDAVRVKFPEIRTQAIDFADISLKQQIEVARHTDILVGVHGAGLTHAMFMEEGRGSVVEIFPRDFDFNGLRAIARERNLRYYKTHATTRKGEQDWHNEDISIDQNDFVDLVDHAVKALYNRQGSHRDIE